MARNVASNAVTEDRSQSPKSESAPSTPAARQALLAAFAKLALNRRYRDFGVEAIVSAARVARSTFYYHFAGKDDLLLHNLRPFLAALAGMPFASRPTTELVHWVEHIWEQRQVAGRLLAGTTGRKIEAALAATLKETFAAELPAALRRQTNYPLLAEQIAGASMSLLKAWVEHRVTAAPAEIAQALWRCAHSLSPALPERPS